MSTALMAPGGEQNIVYFRDGSATPGQRYHNFITATRSALASPDPKHKASLKGVNDALYRLKEVTPNQVQDNRFLSNVSLQYKNDEYIGELLMPPVPVGQLAGQYPTYDKRSRLAAPDDSMAGRSTANEISDSRGTDTYSCKPYALSNHVDVLTLRNQVAPLDEMVDLTEATAELIAYRREKRIATAMTASGNYAASNTTTIAAGSRWDSAGGGNPVKVIQDAVAALWSGRGTAQTIGWCSLDVWNVLSRHPQILDLFKYGGTAPGLATPDMVAKFFGLDGMLVSRAREDTANSGQTAAYSRIWGKYFGVARVARNASLRNASFGYTMRFGNVDTRVWFDPKISTLGGYYAQVSTHEDHKILANDTGYLVVSPVN
jgi:hypothetical protein